MPHAAQTKEAGGVRVLGRYARRANPLLGELLRPMEYYWVTAQAEYSTDVLFRKRYLDALACVDDPTPAIRELDVITRGAITPSR